MKKVSKIKDFCEVILSSEKTIYQELINTINQLNCRILFTLTLDV